MATLVVAGCSLAAGAAGFFAAETYPQEAARGPQLVAGLAVVAAVLVGVNAVRGLRTSALEAGESPVDQGADRTREGPGRTLLTLALAVLVVGYLLLFPVLGFVLSSAVFMSAAGFLLGIRSTLSLVLLGPVSSVLLHLLFTRAFGVGLPTLTPLL